MRYRLLPLALLLACASLAAQTVPAPPLTQESQPQDGRRNQKVERITIEDDGTRIEELRFGGQTQSITVQPKGGVPEYEIQPANLARTRPADQRDAFSGTAGQRVWNILRF